MKFTYDIFNIEVIFDDLSQKGVAGEYRLDTKIIAIDYAHLLRTYDDMEALIEELERIVVHELTHFFDFNCWKSWSYKDETAYEHLATFNEIYYRPIRKFTDSIIEWCLTQELENYEIEQPKSVFIKKEENKVGR